MSAAVLHAGLFAGGLLVGAGSAIALLKPGAKDAPPPAQPPPPAPLRSAPPPTDAAIIPPPGALATALLQSDILRPSGYPGPTADLLPHAVFLSSYDRRLRHPAWTAEHLTAASLRRPPTEAPDRARSVFKEDDRIPPAFRARLADYFRSGYDRGHMVPAADAKLSQAAMDETFYLTNMAPQVGAGFNRDYWAHTEDFVRRLTSAFADVYVFTLPLYLPKLGPDGKHRVTYEVIGNPPNVAVPTHFAKVILASGRPGTSPPPLPAPPSAAQAQGTVFAGLSRQPNAAPPVLDPAYTGLAAFVIPNAVVPNEAPLQSFDVPIDAVERASGLSLFPDAVKTRARHLCSLVKCDIVVREFASATRNASPPSPGASPRR